MNVKDYIAVIASLVALGIAWGMTNQKYTPWKKIWTAWNKL